MFEIVLSLVFDHINIIIVSYMILLLLLLQLLLLLLLFVNSLSPVNDNKWKNIVPHSEVLAYYFLITPMELESW